MDFNVYKLLLTVVLLLQVSERAGHIIEYDKFYIHELDDLVDIRSDYITWFQRQTFPSVSLLVIIACLSNSFILYPRTGQFQSCLLYVVALGWNSTSNFLVRTHRRTVDCGFVSSGSRRFGDSLQVSLRI